MQSQSIKCCVRCGDQKPIDQFPTNRATTDNLSSWCKACHSQYSKDWLAAHPAQQRERMKRWAANNSDYFRLIRRAGNAVKYAVMTGKLARPDRCEECGQVVSVEAAHFDYSRVLDVRWLCHSCHQQWDSAVPKRPK